MTDQDPKYRFAPFKRWGQPATIAVALVVEVLAAAFFIGDSLQELATDVDKRHPLTEFPIAIALCFGAFFTIRELRRMLRHTHEQDRALALASGAFLQVVERQFSLWRLTPAERDVAWLSLKGVDLAEIAVLRGSANGTVRAQLARIYEKAGVTSRAQLASVFVDELMGRLPSRTAETDKTAPGK
jgi:DNA-binding CsgD family transcriptional regulator